MDKYLPKSFKNNQNCDQEELIANNSGQSFRNMFQFELIEYSTEESIILNFIFNRVLSL